jgi:hypothetical protein
VNPPLSRGSEPTWGIAVRNASPTALVIAMDAENDFATKAKRDEVRRKLQAAIREEIKYQDADIGQDELDYLIHIVCGVRTSTS